MVSEGIGLRSRRHPAHVSLTLANLLTLPNPLTIRDLLTLGHLLAPLSRRLFCRGAAAAAIAVRKPSAVTP